MFYQPKNLIATPAKKIIYVTAATVLGLLLSFIIHAIAESLYLNWAIKNDAAITWHTVFNQGQCALPLLVVYGLPVLGALSGFLSGRLWWRLVYVDKFWQKK